MNKEKLLAGAVVLMFAAVLVGAGAPENAPPAWQTSPEVIRGAEVIPEVKHDTSPPLREMTVLHSPPGERAHEIHLLHPPRAVQFISDPVLQTSTLPAVPTSIGLSFDGVGANGSAPPDTNGAAGATQFVEWVNTEFAVYDKANKNLLFGPAAGNTLWQGFGGPCQTNNDGDPIAQYDKLNNRWVMSQFSVTGGPPFFQCVAVSTTSDATGTWNRYAFQQPNFNDYPKMGIWSDAYYESFNMFSGNILLGARACAFDSASMRAGVAATEQCFQLSSSFGGLLPSDVDGTTPPPAGEPAFFVNFDSSTLNSLNLWRFHVDFSNSANSTFTGPTSLSVAPFSEACGGGTCVPQLGTTQKLDSLGDRLMYRLAYRNFLPDHESLVTNHSIVAGSSVGVRWYELRDPNGNPFVFQQGTFAPDSNFRWMGSIAMDKAGNIAAGFSVSSSGIHPAIRYTGRVPSDPLGMLESETSIIEGTGSQTHKLNRWGDYSSMALDPTDDCTFWYANEYLQTNGTFNWSTRIASFKFPSCPILSSLTLNPTSVAGGNSSQGAVTLSGAAPAGGAVVNLSSSNTTVATVPPSVTVPAGATSATFTVTTSAVAASASVTISATYGSTQTATLTVTAPPNFTLSASPSSLSITQGASGTSTITVTPQNGFSGSVSLSASGLPSGVTASFSPNPTTTTSTLTLTASSTATTGTVTVTITGTSGSLTNTTTITLTVQASGITVIPQTGWSLKFVDSQETSCGVYPATYSFDGNNSTFWHTQFCPSSTPLPHEIQINLGASYNISGFRYLPRQDGSPNGSISQYEFYVSVDGVNWGAPVSTGSLNYGVPIPPPNVVTTSLPAVQVLFTTITGQYVRLRALSEVNGLPYTSMAELSILASSTPSPTTVSSLTLNPATVTAGNSSQGTVTLSGPAPAGGAVVNLLSSNTTVATVPPSVTVAAGATSATFTVTTSAVAASTSVTISATYGSTRTATLTVQASLTVIPQTGWSLKFVDSQETGCYNGAAVNSFDGNNNTMWHTQFCPSSPPPPHEIQINLGASYNISGFRYLPRQDGCANGWISQYEFYVSVDGVNWGAPVSTGTFNYGTASTSCPGASVLPALQILFTTTTGQYVRLRALSEVNGNPWTSMAELNILAQ